MTYDENPFPEADGDRHAIWEMLMRRDFEAFLAQGWAMVEDDFIAEGFFGLHAHGRSNPDSWKLGFPNLAAYRAEWLRQAAETAGTDNGRKALYVNADYTKHFEGMTEEESAPLLEYLYAHACRPAFTWRHHWELGDLLLWDNASVQHAVVPDVASGERLLHRVTIVGDVPV